MGIKNIIFDIGNVLVRWAPLEVIKFIFPECDPQTFYQQIHPLWIDLNLGKLTEKEAIAIYQKQFNLPRKQITCLMHTFKQHQKPLPGSLALLKELKVLSIPLYSITDNIREIMAYHFKNSDFPCFFKDILVSADIGILKPDPRIYKHLINKHNLIPGESLFIDDVIKNVEGALSIGMHAFQFTDMLACREQLIQLGIPLTHCS